MSVVYCLVCAGADCKGGVPSEEEISRSQRMTPRTWVWGIKLTLRPTNKKAALSAGNCFWGDLGH